VTPLWHLHTTIGSNCNQPHQEKRAVVLRHSLKSHPSTRQTGRKKEFRRRSPPPLSLMLWTRASSSSCSYNTLAWGRWSSSFGCSCREIYGTDSVSCKERRFTTGRHLPQSTGSRRWTMKRREHSHTNHNGDTRDASKQAEPKESSESAAPSEKTHTHTQTRMHRHNRNTREATVQSPRDAMMPTAKPATQQQRRKIE